MEKNYYELLGVATDASTEEITDAFETIRKEKYPDGLATEDETKRAEYMDLFNGKKILTDVDTRSEYDESLRKSSKSGIKNLQVSEKAKSVLKNEKVRFAALIVAAAFIGSMLGNGFSNYFGNKNTRNGDNNSTSIVNEMDTSEPIVEEKLLTAENFEEKVQEIMSSNNTKGLQTDISLVRSSLLLTNLSYFSDEELAKLIDEDINMETELQNLLYYVSQVENFNRISSLNNQVSLADLAYDDLDKEMLTELNSKCYYLKSSLQDSSLSNDEKTTVIEEVLPYIEKFTVGDGYLTLSNGNYRKQNLSAGAGILAESYCQVIGDEIVDCDELFKSEYKPLIDTINKNTDGLTYINALYQFDLAPCLEIKNQTASSENTLTKTQ